MIYQAKNLMAAAMMCPAMMYAASQPDVTGTILDAEGQPMGFANVVLLSLPDSAFVQGATSDVDGRFNIVCPEDKGLLKVSCVGFETQYVEITDGKLQITDDKCQITIRMREDAQVLNEITVKGQLPKTKLTGNSMVTAITGSVLEKSGTLKEMLAKVPGMTQRGDDLEVLGKGKPVYYINGRKVSDLDELKRLRSEEIKEVEVITNPGAQYDATVTAVVRIKTVRRDGNGFGYDLSAANNQDLRYGSSDPSATLNLRYRHKSLDVFGMANYWEWTSINDSKPNQWTWLKGDEGQINTIEQRSKFRTDWMGKGMNYNLGFNWQVADNHSVGMRVEYHDRLKGITTADIESYMKQEGVLNCLAYSTEEHSVSTQRNKTAEPFNWEGNAYYNGRVGKLGIDLNVDFLTNKSRETNDIEEIQNRGNILPIATTTRTTSRMLADKLVLSYPVGQGQLNVGTEMSFVTRKSAYLIEGIDLPATDSEVQENNIAAFVEYACQIPHFGNVSAGVRYEHVGFDYTDNLHADKSMSRYTDDLFPSLSWSNQFGSWQTAVSYSFKTIRPRYYMLDDAIQYLNQYSLQQGDSKLKNATMQEVSANVRWKWVNLYAAYERRDNAMTQWTYNYDNDGVMLIKWINFETPMRNFAAFLTASPTWGVYSPSWTMGFQQPWVKQTLVDPREAAGKREVSFNKPLVFFDCNNTFRLKHSWQLEANMNLMSHGNSENYYLTNTAFKLSLVVQKCWLKNDALCLRASLSDIFQRSGNDVVMDCGYYVLQQSTRYNSNRLDVSVRYTFNAAQSKYKGTGAGREAASRMSSN